MILLFLLVHNKIKTEIFRYYLLENSTAPKLYKQKQECAAVQK